MKKKAKQEIRLNKKIVYKSKSAILQICVCWGLIFICTWTGLIGGAIFFLLCGVVLTYSFVNLRNKIIFINTKTYKEKTNEEFNERLTETGIFTYTESGFDIQLADGHHAVAWENIRALLGYKIDLYAVDKICLDFFFYKLSCWKGESTPGWFVFLDEIAEQIPAIDKSWSIKIAFPPFATNLTLLYESMNRSLEQAILLYYPNKAK